MKIYIVHGKRTPFGKFGGSLKSTTPVDLAVHSSKSLLEDIDLDPKKVDQVILGNVMPSSTDTLYGGRHLALKLGCDEKTPGLTLNRLCGSGAQVVIDAARMIKLGEAQCILTAGSENMSMAPHLTYGGRFGTKYGALQVVDMLMDALTDKYAGTPMAITAENLAKQYSITRDECDEYAFESHQRASRAYNEGFFKDEITPIALKRGDCSRDEHLREDASLEQMKSLRSAFLKDGVVSAANASGVVDGASSLMIASEDFCKKENLTPLAEIIDYSVVGVDPTIMGIGPVPAIREILKNQKMSLDDIDLVEINEAFAAQTLACAKELKLDRAKLNIWGGAISLGHPLAASGSRITLSLARQLKAMKKEYGIASACIGGGQGIALLIKSIH